MDAHLKLLAEAGLAIGEAEEALDAGDNTHARDLLDAAEAHLASLRDAWPDMSAAERKIIGSSAKPVSERAAAAARRIPKRTTLSEGAPEVDPDEDVEPGAAPIVTDHRP